MTDFEHGAATDTGKVRPVNQDRYLAKGNLFAVADGMGGHVGGEVAAKSAVDELYRGFENDGTLKGLAAALRGANLAVWNQGMDELSLRGMGTTLTACAIIDSPTGPILGLAHVGDSRAYLYRGGRLAQLTQDHTLVEELVKRGQLTPVQALTDKRRHTLTRALGIDPHLVVDTAKIRLEVGDRILICSDGLSNEVSDREICTLIERDESPDVIAQDMVRLARAHGGRDNITAVVLTIGSLSKKKRHSSQKDIKKINEDLKHANDPLATEPVDMGDLDYEVTDVVDDEKEKELVDVNLQSNDLLDPEKTVSSPVDGNSIDDELPGLAGVSINNDEIVPSTAGSEIPVVAREAKRVSKSGGGAHSSSSSWNKLRLVYDLSDDSNYFGQRRRRRGPPPFTGRTVLFFGVIAVALVSSYFTTRWFVENSYFVGLNNGKVAIFQGRPGGVAWFKPHVVSTSNLTVNDILPSQGVALKLGVLEPSVSKAQSIIENLKKQQKDIGIGGVAATTTTIPSGATTTSQGSPNG